MTVLKNKFLKRKKLEKIDLEDTSEDIKISKMPTKQATGSGLTSIFCGLATCGFSYFLCPCLIFAP